MASLYSVGSAAKDHNRHVVNPPTFNSRAIKKYLKTRFTTLIAPKEERAGLWHNPFKPLGELNRRQWAFFFVGYFAWTWDALDFFAVSLNVASIAEQFGKEPSDVSWGITLVLMLRSVGAVIFGLVGDRFGTKIPYIVALLLLIVLQIGCGFVQTFQQFLGVRALFGIAMGGVYGVALSTAYGCSKEPVTSLNYDYISTINEADIGISKNARGIVGGIFQQGYALGYLLAVVFTRALVYTAPEGTEGWRRLFWFSAGPPVIFIVWRLLLPETDDYLIKTAKLAAKRKREGGASGLEATKIQQFLKDGKACLKIYWLMFIYCILMMSGFNFFSHGSQDVFPTLLTTQLGFSKDASTVTNSVANLGAIAGGFVFGHVSTFIGRRISIIIAAVLSGAMIYPWAFVKNTGINAAVFFLQFGVQGAWGVIPAHLSELAPPDYRMFVVGLSYQLGNLCSSASSTIETTIGERFPITGAAGGATFDYGKVMAIFLACVVVYLIVVVLFGPENRGASFDIERDVYVDDLEDGVKEEDDSDEEAHAAHVKSEVTHKE